MGGRGIKRPKVKPKPPQNEPRGRKKEAPKKMPLDPPVTPRKKTGRGSGTGEGGGTGGADPNVPVIPKKEEKKETESKTLRIGGFYYKLENGKLIRIGSRKEEHEVGKDGVTIKIGGKEYHISEKGFVRELPPKEKSDAEKLAKYLDGYTSTSESFKPGDRRQTLHKKMKAQASETVEIFKKSGIGIPTNEQMINTFKSIGIDEDTANDFVNKPHYYWDMYTDERKGGKKPLEKFYVENEELHQASRLNAYLIAKSIDDVKKNVLNDDLFKDRTLINSFRLYNVGPQIGGGMDGKNNYYIPTARLSVAKFNNPPKGFGEHNVDFTLPGVAIHELGHAVHNIIKSKNPEIQKDIEKLYYMSHIFKLRPSNYAMMTDGEFFAETFLGYIKYKQWGHDTVMRGSKNELTNKPVFDKNNPMFEAMEEILKKSGLLKGSTSSTGRVSKETFDKVEKYIFEDMDWEKTARVVSDPLAYDKGTYEFRESGRPLKEIFKEQYKKYGMK